MYWGINITIIIVSAIILIYTVGVIGYIWTNTEELDEDFRWEIIDLTPAIARKSLVWPIILLYEVILGLFCMIKCVGSFILALFSKSNV